MSDPVWPHGLFVAHQAPLSRGFPSQEHWSGLPCPPPGDPPDPRIEPRSLLSPAFPGKFFTMNATWEDPTTLYSPTSGFLTKPEHCLFLGIKILKEDRKGKKKIPRNDRKSFILDQGTDNTWVFLGPSLPVSINLGIFWTLQRADRTPPDKVPFYIYIYNFIYLCLATLGLFCFAWAFSSCS